MASRTDFDEFDIRAGMIEAGVPDRIAGRAYHFTEIAWARSALEGLGATLSPDYLCFNSAGEVIESGRLEEEPYFVAATLLAERYKLSPGFRQVILMSAEFKAINKALLSGSKAKDLVVTPFAVFLESPTPAGLEKMKRTIAQHLPLRTAGGSSPTSAKKPWWRFWR